MIELPVFYAFAIPAVLITGISKGGFGGGLGLIAVPLMSFAIPPLQAAAIMLPLLCAMDFFSVLQFRTWGDRKNLTILLPAALLGIGVGTVSFHYLNEAQIRLLIGIVALSFVVNYLRQRRHEAQSASIMRGGLWGCVAGFTSFGVHAGGRR